MGGATNGLFWNMGYDSVLEFTAVETTTGAAVPAYVDDNEALVVGPRQVASLAAAAPGTAAAPLVAPTPVLAPAAFQDGRPRTLHARRA